MAKDQLVDGRYVLISGDSHAGASRPEDYRDYVDPKFRDEFDRWAASYYEPVAGLDPQGAGEERFVFERGDGDDNRFTRLLNAMTRGGMGLPNATVYDFLDEKYFSQRREAVSGTWDPKARQAIAEADGVVGEVIHPDGVLGCTAPMVHLAAPSTDQSPEARALEAAGRRAYNHWLADLCNELPGRRAGVALIGFDDVDAAVADVRAAHASGLFGGVALKDPINVGLPGLADKRYDPLWAVCEELSMPLNAHAGAGFPGDLAGYMNDPLNFVLLTTLESTLVSSKRVIWHLMAGGAFDRFPALRLVVTEQHMGWVEPLLRELDLGCSKVWWARPMYEQRSALKPSELWARQCFASAFMNRAEAEQYAPYANALNVMWGSDYPHPEGTNPHTRISLRQCFHDLPVDTVATMVGGNMMRAFDFDEKAIRAAAARFGPTPEDIASAPSPDEVPYWAEQSPSFVAGELTTV